MGTEHGSRAVVAWVLGVLGVLALTALALSFAFAPEAMANGAPLRALGVVPRICPGCPLCGMSRAFSAASHLELHRALRFNPGVLLAYPLAVACAIAGPWLLVRHLIRRSP